MKLDDKQILEVINNRIVIEWMMGNWCNFRCAYCFDQSNLGTHKAPEVTPLLQNNVTFLVNQIRKHNPGDHIRWTLTGGEPTAQKKFELLLSTLNDIDSNSHVMLVTNGTRPIEWWKNNIRQVEHIVLSHHPESKVEHNVELIKLLAEHKIKTGVSVMAGNQNFDQAVNDYKTFSALTIPEQFTHIDLKINRYRLTRRNNQFKDLTKEQHNILDNLQQDHNSKKQIGKEKNYKRKNRIDDSFNKFEIAHIKHNEGIETLDWYKGKRTRYQGDWVGYKCYAEGRAMHIKFDGSMGHIPCGVKFYEDGYLNIYNEDFVNKYKYNNAPYICDKSYMDCRCVMQLEVKKEL